MTLDPETYIPNYEYQGQLGQDEPAPIKHSGSEQWLQRHPEAGSSWPSWSS